MTWHNFAACKEMGSELFFPNVGDHKQAQAAKRVCAACEVREQCLDDALESGQAHGVWGGMTVRERRRESRRRRAVTLRDERQSAPSANTAA